MSLFSAIDLKQKLGHPPAEVDHRVFVSSLTTTIASSSQLRVQRRRANTQPKSAIYQHSNGQSSSTRASLVFIHLTRSSLLAAVVQGPISLGNSNDTRAPSRQHPTCAIVPKGHLRSRATSYQMDPTTPHFICKRPLVVCLTWYRLPFHHHPTWAVVPQDPSYFYSARTKRIVAR
jgi:hypothetical protein